MLSADSFGVNLPFFILLSIIVVFTQPGWIDATLILPFNLFDKILVYIFNALFDILYATESVNSQTSNEPIFEEIFKIIPFLLIILIKSSVKKTVPVTFTLKVPLKEFNSGIKVSKSGPIPALFIRISMLTWGSIKD